MGQLEKYGLYVLCLVIFLILGVALWGEPASAATDPTKTAETARRDGQRAPSYDLAGLKEFNPKELMSLASKPEGTGGSGAPSNTHGGRPVAPAAEGAGRDADRPRTDVGERSNGETPPGPAPEAPAARPTHTIVSGDTLEEIAKGLGDVRLVATLLELNPKVSPGKLQIGKQLLLPTPAEIAAVRGKNAEPAPKNGAKEVAKEGAAAKDGSADTGRKPSKPAAAVRTHRIVSGDTLEDLSRRYFGTKQRVDDIKKLNPGVDPTRLRIGQVIRLPAD